MKGRPASILLALAIPILLAWLPGDAGAQAPSRDQPTDTATGPSPGGAFLRGLILPGWGHASVGAYGRGGFYFVTAGATAWMLAKTGHFLSEAEEREALVVEQARGELREGGVEDPDSLAVLLDEDRRVEGARDLVEVRSQQMEDWTAFGLFWLFLNAADAFVSAHLRDFPEPIDVDTRAVPSPGGPRGIRAEVRVRIPVGPPR